MTQKIGNLAEKRFMKDRVFIDTNILVYLYSKTEPQNKQIVLKLLSSKNVIISTQVIGEFVWVMYRKFGVERENLKIIGNRLLEKLEVVSINPKTVKKALNIFEVYKFSYWDSLIVASALEANCSILYTEDMRDGQIIENRLKIVNPFTI